MTSDALDDAIERYLFGNSPLYVDKDDEDWLDEDSNEEDSDVT